MKIAIFNSHNTLCKYTMPKQIGIIALFAILLLTSCKTLQPTIAPQNHDSVAVRTEYRVDSIYIDRYHTEYVKGDTIYRIDSLVDYRYRILTKTDSIYVRDSIPYPVEVPVITNEVPAFYKNCTIALWVIIGLVLLYIVLRIWLKR